ncbi:hypothetical protein GCM10023216_27240 [Isoptericola chiayiensis]|uniref:DUF4439 domain-containing protein n=1 Tax=Isoptericola chiayiensis TaxID=579446 RepID=A0ABP8YP36_9MICO|nr:DUF4439 domain-containing protein [Isoptericola chiayiensis]NOW01486.1 putative small lipoprotein YifL [Isoptericola chiayiensis]
MEPHHVTPPGRRRLRALAGLLAVAVLAGCGLRLETPPPAEPVPDALEIVRRTAVSDALYVADQADAVVDRLDGRRARLTAELERVAADSRAQAAQLGGVYDSGLEPTEPPTGSPAPSSEPVQAQDVVDALVDASGRSRTAASTTVEGPLARLLASIGAAQAVSAQRVGAYTDAGPPPTQVATVPAPDGTAIVEVEPSGESPAADAAGSAGSGLAALTAASPSPSPSATDDGEVSSTGGDSDAPAPLPRGLTAADLSTLVASEDSAAYALRLRAALRTDDRRAALAGRADTHGARSEAWALLAGTAGTAQDPRRVAYAVPRGAGDGALVRSVENDLATTYATIVGTTAPDTRGALVDLLVDCALALEAWGAEPVPFPGLPEQADDAG